LSWQSQELGYEQYIRMLARLEKLQGYNSSLPLSAIMVKIHALASLFGLASVVAGQQVYLEANGSTPRPECPKCTEGEPQYTFTPFHYSMTSTVRYATSRASPTCTTTYAPPLESLTSLIGAVSYTTWGKWDPAANASATDTANPYGNAAWTNLWKMANPPNFTQDAANALFSTTVEPTPVPTEELVLPPRDYFGPTDCYNFPPGFEKLHLLWTF
jgi:hypothetical protein